MSTKQTHRRSVHRSNTGRWGRTALLFLAPFGLLYLFMWAFPIVRGFYTSLTDTNLARGTGVFTGWENYRELFTDAEFGRTLGNTVVFVVGNVPILVTAGLLLALLLNTELGGRAAIRAAFVSPYLLPGAAIAIIWQFVLNPATGPLNKILSGLGLPSQDWLSQPDQAMGAVILITLWWRVGFPLLVLLAALQDIPADLYESARLDGANAWQRFRYVTLPGIAPVLGLVVILRLIDSFKVFEQAYLVTGGGPDGTTRVVLQQLYEVGFRDFRTGYASAIGWSLALLILIVTLVQFVFLRRSERNA